MTGFTKLYESIIRSSVWSEDDKTRIMWITMLASANQNGHVTGSVPGMAAMARMTVPEAEKAIATLCGPDPYSQTPDKQGARLTLADGGWDVVNHKKYREGRDPVKRQEQNRSAQERFRSKPKVSQNKPTSAQAEAEAEAEADNISAALTSKPSVSKRAEKEFDTQFWPNVPMKTGVGAARKAYIKARKTFSAETILAGLPKFQAYEDIRKAQPDYRPLHPATWLNQERWADEVASPDQQSDSVAAISARLQAEGKIPK